MNTGTKLASHRVAVPWAQNRQSLIDITSGVPHKVDAAQRQLIKDNEGLVRCIAHEYSWACSGRTKYSDNTIDVEDLYHVGRIGMLFAAKKFDLNHSVEFVSYASKFIRSWIQKVVHCRGAIYVPPNRRFKIARLLKAEEHFKHVGDSIELAKAVKSALHLTDDSFNALQETRTHLSIACVSLEEPLRAHGDGEAMSLTRQDMLWKSPATGEINFGTAFGRSDEEIQEEPDAKKLFDTLCARAKLDVRQICTLRLYHGMFGETQLNYRKIGELLGVTHQRARQIERRAFEKLCAAARAGQTIES